MKFFIGITDKQWFDSLAHLQPDEVNFWKPGGGVNFRAIDPGSLFLFKLRKPYHAIVGGGFFVRFSILPVSLAWEAFEQKNGRQSQQELLATINSLRAIPQSDPFIGCTVLTAPFFLPQSDWIPAPPSWSNSIVQGKTYDSNEGEGRLIWEQVSSAISTQRPSATISQTAIEAARYGEPRMVTPRLGQGGFRVAVTEAYQRRCAMTGEKTLPVLIAAHIRPLAREGPHLASNGLLLRSDIHTLFDRGLLCITPELNIEVSSRIRADFGNGRHYYALHGQPLQTIPSVISDRPDREFIDWHLNNVYKP
jgi:putative restriction endonuclease